MAKTMVGPVPGDGKHQGKQEGISVECQTPVCQQFVVGHVLEPSMGRGGLGTCKVRVQGWNRVQRRDQ